jgi:hypothetical protein
MERVKASKPVVSRLVVLRSTSSSTPSTGSWTPSMEIGFSS